MQCQTKTHAQALSSKVGQRLGVARSRVHFHSEMMQLERERRAEGRGLGAACDEGDAGHGVSGCVR